MFGITEFKRNIDIEWVILYIVIKNTTVPKVCEFIDYFESHPTEGRRQQSLYIKLALFRCFNSGLVLQLVTNFIDTISLKKNSGNHEYTLVYVVFPVIFSELFTIPIIKMCDFKSNFQKHFLAPRARNQVEMDACMVGGKFDISERYTDATKVLFVAMFYSSVMPESYFLGAATLAVHFFFGKFCLLRMWRTAPDIGTQLTRGSRYVFFSGFTVVHLTVSAFFWSGYPYDQVCSDDEGGYVFCNQNMLGSYRFPLPRFQGDFNWMTPSQELITSLYGWSSVVAIITGAVFYARMTILPAILSIVQSTYKPDGKDQDIDFYQVKHLQEVQAYIPQIREDGFVYPLIACNIDNIDPDLIGWRDCFDGFNPHNLTYDVAEIMKYLPAEKEIFSIVKQWPHE